MEIKEVLLEDGRYKPVRGPGAMTTRLFGSKEPV
jgi:hypothetical protein